MPDLRDPMLARMQRTATLVGIPDDGWTECIYDGPGGKLPRWRIDQRWIEFECGCRAERCMALAQPSPYDPIIFKDLPEQAVYDFVCQKHGAAMNARLRFLGFADFKQWHRIRRAVIMRKVRY